MSGEGLRTLPTLRQFLAGLNADQMIECRRLAPESQHDEWQGWMAAELGRQTLAESKPGLLDEVVQVTLDAGKGFLHVAVDNLDFRVTVSTMRWEHPVVQLAARTLTHSPPVLRSAFECWLVEVLDEINDNDLVAVRLTRLDQLLIRADRASTLIDWSVRRGAEPDVWQSDWTAFAIQIHAEVSGDMARGGLEMALSVWLLELREHYLLTRSVAEAVDRFRDILALHAPHRKTPWAVPYVHRWLPGIASPVKSPGSPMFPSWN